MPFPGLLWIHIRERSGEAQKRLKKLSFFQQSLVVGNLWFVLIFSLSQLEEGEKDFVRAQEYKYCMHK